MLTHKNINISYDTASHVIKQSCDILYIIYGRAEKGIIVVYSISM